MSESLLDFSLKTVIDRVRAVRLLDEPRREPARKAGAIPDRSFRAPRH